MAARTQTIDFLISRMDKLCDTENDAHLSSAEKFEIVNSAIAETWDVIINAGLGDKYVKSATFSTVAGTQEYDLFTIASDFYRIHQLYVDEGSGQFRPLQSVAPAEVQSFRPPQSVVPMKLYYVPYSPVLTTGQSFDGINGWEEHTLMTACAAVKMKKEDDYTRYAQRKRELEQRIHAMGKTDLAEPKRVVRKRSRICDPYLLYQNNVNAYLVRGDKLNIFYNYGYIV